MFLILKTLQETRRRSFNSTRFPLSFPVNFCLPNKRGTHTADTMTKRKVLSILLPKSVMTNSGLHLNSIKKLGQQSKVRQQNIPEHPEILLAKKGTISHNLLIQ